jgi:predicted amidophosphoribosyltransferase
MLKYTHRPGGSANCPQCREAISREAKICPHCQSDLTQDEEWQAQKSKNESGCAALLILGLSASFLGGLSLLLMVF